MVSRRRSRSMVGWALVAALAVVTSACGPRPSRAPRAETSSSSSAAPSSVATAGPTSLTSSPEQLTPSSPTATSPIPSRAAPTTARPKPRPAVPRISLPRGGRRILPDYRVVAYYGGPDGPALGALGGADPDSIAATIAARAAQFAPFGRRIQPAMELIATVARSCNGGYPLCTAPIPDEAVQRYLDAAHRHKLLLILDFQPGRGEFLPQVQAVEGYLRDPSVSVALDPEWKLGPDQSPMQVIGSSSASSVNAVTGYLSTLVARNRLPDKLLIVHQFTPSMLPDRGGISRAPGVEVAFHADGFGSTNAKVGVFAGLAFPGAPFRTGFKLFLKQDTGLMTPAQVMALRPQPDIVTYQ